MAPWQPSGILKLPGMSLNTVLAISSGDSTEHREYNSFTEFRTGKHVCVCVCVCVCVHVERDALWCLLSKESLM